MRKIAISEKKESLNLKQATRGIWNSLEGEKENEMYLYYNLKNKKKRRRIRRMGGGEVEEE